MRRRIQALLMGGALSFLVGGCGIALGPPQNAPPPTKVVLLTTKVPGLGTVLTNSSGFVLYVFGPDQHSQMRCNKLCQDVWPAVSAPLTGEAKGEEGVKQSLIGSVPNPVTGHPIVTYNGWPLYTYTSDEQQGQASGQNIYLNGGYWWVITPNGRIETKNPPKAAASS